MSQNAINFVLENLLTLDTSTKSLISKLETVHHSHSSVKARRENIDIYQNQIKENITAINTIIDELQVLELEQKNASTRSVLRQTINDNKNQLVELQNRYRKAIFHAVSTLETCEREELFNYEDRTKFVTGDPEIEEQFQHSLELTRDMVSYARQLAEEVERGNSNSELLEASSKKIASNYTELKDMAGHINQSQRLTSMAHRRRLTERVLFTLAFLFFFLSCGTIFLRRMPMGSWLLPAGY